MNKELRDLIMAIPAEKIDEVSSAIISILHSDLPTHKSPEKINRNRVLATISPRNKVCPACNQDTRSGNLVPIWDNLESTYAHALCIGVALKNGWYEGHHNIAKRSHNSWLVFWQGECGEVKTRKQAKELLKQLNEGDSTGRGGTR